MHMHFLRNISAINFAKCFIGFENPNTRWCCIGTRGDLMAGSEQNSGKSTRSELDLGLS